MDPSVWSRRGKQYTCLSIQLSVVFPINGPLGWLHSLTKYFPDLEVENSLEFLSLPPDRDIVSLHYGVLSFNCPAILDLDVFASQQD
jgi:hypothetical protein